MANALQGNWKLFFIDCFDAEIIDVNNKLVYVTFYKNKTYSLNDNGQIINGKWHFNNEDAGVLGINTVEYTPYFDGRILLCSDEVEFNNSYLDGCDYYFRRTK